MLVSLVHAFAYKSEPISDEMFTDIRKVKGLKFTKNEFAKLKNGKNVPQIKVNKVEFTPDYIECDNVRYNGNYPVWKCTASDPQITVTEYSIECDGKENDNDYFVSTKSCRLTCSLILPSTSRYYDYTQQPAYKAYNKFYDTYSKFYANGKFKDNFQAQPIKLEDISILVFEKGKKTTSQKREIFDQLTPVEGNEYEPDQVICRNVGFDGESIIWQCKAHIPTPNAFLQAHVSCEGFHGAGDKEVVPGSCMLEYKIGKPQEVVQASAAGIICFFVVVVFLVICWIKCGCPTATADQGNVVHHVHHYPEAEKKKEDDDDKEKRQTAYAKTSTR